MDPEMFGRFAANSQAGDDASASFNFSCPKLSLKCESTVNNLESSSQLDHKSQRSQTGLATYKAPRRPAYWFVGSALLQAITAKIFAPAAQIHFLKYHSVCRNLVCPKIWVRVNGGARETETHTCGRAA